MKTTITKRIKHLVLAMFASLLLMPTIVVAQIIIPTTGDFATDQKDTWIDLDEPMHLLQVTNMMTCILKKTGAHLVVNDTYDALVDFSLCGLAGEPPIIVTVKTSRANSTSPQLTNMWFELQGTPVLLQAEVKKEVSNTAPLGSSRIKIGGCSFRY